MARASGPRFVAPSRGTLMNKTALQTRLVPAVHMHTIMMHRYAVRDVSTWSSI